VVLYLSFEICISSERNWQILNIERNKVTPLQRKFNAKQIPHKANTTQSKYNAKQMPKGNEHLFPTEKLVRAKCPDLMQFEPCEFA